MTRTVKLHRPINAQIGPVDNQLDFEKFVIVLIKAVISLFRLVLTFYYVFQSPRSIEENLNEEEMQQEEE